MAEKEIPHIPLPERMRPDSLDNFRGQEKLIGKGKPLRNMIEKNTISSFILWGPPGTGKTTLAKIISKHTNAEFYRLNAVSSGVKDLRNVIDIARENLNYHRKTILFIDEIHRFNKSQQDALLSSVESGEIILIGATTENPSFEIIPALRSRVRIFVLEELSLEEMENILDIAKNQDEFLKSLNIISVDKEFLFYLSGGDARSLLNIFEAAVIQEIDKEEIIINKEVIENVLQKKSVNFDKNGEEHYNIISAFIKSIRGSEPDAALYWLARMIEGGEDPLFIARRLIIAASEDIGNASPNALLLAEATFSGIEKIGMPEGRILLAQCTTYLAASPKSNAAYNAINKALSDVQNNKNFPVPIHLRNAPTKFMQNIGYGKGYKYPHDYENNFIQEKYLPEEIKNTQYYFPTSNGIEKTLKDRLTQLWKGIKKY